MFPPPPPPPPPLEIHKSMLKCYIFISFAAFIQTPTNTTVCLGSTAQFVCSATGAYIVTYLLNSMVVQNPSPYANLSAPTFSGNGSNITTVNITIFSALVGNDTSIACRAYWVSGTTLTSTAYLRVQGNVYVCYIAM